MRTPVIVAVASLFLGCAAHARAETSEPSYDRIRAGLERTAPILTPTPTDVDMAGSKAFEPERRQRTRQDAPAARNRVRTNGRDSVWNGLLIGAGIGAGSGYLWARQLCGSNDSECFAIAAPVGVLGGAGIGAAAGAVLDALQK